MKHLTADELIDVVEGTIPADQQSHLNTCVACRNEVAQLALVLRDVRTTTVPEPSPLFWDRLSDRIRMAVAGEAAPGAFRWPLSLRWPVLAPLAAMGLIIFALANVIRVDPLDSPPQVAEIDSSSSTSAEDSWTLVADIVGTFDLESIQEAGVSTPLGSADRALLGMSNEEQDELLRLLEQELKGAGS